MCFVNPREGKGAVDGGGGSERRRHRGWGRGMWGPRQFRLEDTLVWPPANHLRERRKDHKKGETNAGPQRFKGRGLLG